MRGKHATLTEERLKGHKGKLDEADKLFRDDPNYKKLVEEQV